MGGVILGSLRRVATIAGVWLLAAGFFSWQRHQIAMLRGEADVVARIVNTTAVMLIWVFFTPPLLSVGRRFPVRGRKGVRNAALVLFIACVAALVKASLDVALGLNVTDSAASVMSLFHMHLLFALIIIGVGNFLLLEEEENARRHRQAVSEAESAEAVLRQLRADLNPHFLFNTINAVATLLHSDPERAAEMVLKLREFLRRSVATEQAREVRLEDELALASQYLDIQKMRYGGKLVTSVQISERRLCDAAIPPLLLQPLIENSFVHGISRRRDGGSVAVLVDELKTEDEPWLRIQIRDTGPGCDPAAVFAPGRLGVANAKARLESLYGTRQSLTYRQDAQWFVAEVTLPLRMVKT
jgi:hypothetical protein